MYEYHACINSEQQNAVDIVCTSRYSMHVCMIHDEKFKSGIARSDLRVDMAYTCKHHLLSISQHCICIQCWEMLRSQKTMMEGFVLSVIVAEVLNGIRSNLTYSTLKAKLLTEGKTVHLVSFKLSPVT